MRFRTTVVLLLLLVLLFDPSVVFAEEPSHSRSLHHSTAAALAGLPATVHVLIDPATVEQFLVALDGRPPDWAQVYGVGHHDPGLDDRLFALNRERDARREGAAPLSWPVAFLWQGELSTFDEEADGFRVVLGPRFIPTRWGDVRFKPEDLSGNLLVSAGAQTAAYRARIAKDDSVAVDIVMIGRLIPDESVIYDFSHEAEGRGLIMPVVRIERIECAVADRPQ